MGSGWHEWPLVIFTVFGQCAVGAILVMGFVLMRESNGPARERILRMMFFVWLVMGAGFIASVLHLGSPLRAFNSLNRIGASALSNEIASGSLFFAVGGLGWLLAMLKKLPDALYTAWLVITQILGIGFVWAMTRVYQIDTVPTWHNGYTTLGFFLTVLLGGPIFAALLLQAAKVKVHSQAAALSVLALLFTSLQPCYRSMVRCRCGVSYCLLPGWDAGCAHCCDASRQKPGGLLQGLFWSSWVS